MFRLLLTAAACLAVTASPSLPERAASADRVALVEIGPQRTVVPDGNVRRMLTLTQVAVLQDLKGKGPALLTVVQAGGKSGLWESHVAGDARLEAGERAVLFLRIPDAAHPDACTLSGLGLGKLDVQGDVAVVSGQRRPLAEVVKEIQEAKR
ncbi:MAG TPA: hypothetical protein VFA20_18825 [Myxococcaceae bacterium]|nr:hypothetical protein [Myxococcaceae bacterium]